MLVSEGIMRKPTIKEQHLKALTECESVTGKSVQFLLDEALQQYIEADVSSYMEEVADGSASA